eukprot:13549368-Alexandrium_andersonii.AAC.1
MAIALISGLMMVAIMFVICNIVTFVDTIAIPIAVATARLRLRHKSGEAPLRREPRHNSGE